MDSKSSYWTSLVQALSVPPKFLSGENGQEACRFCSHCQHKCTSNKETAKTPSFGNNNSIAGSAMEVSNVPLIWDASSPFNSLPFNVGFS